MEFRERRRTRSRFKAQLAIGISRNYFSWEGQCFALSRGWVSAYGASYNAGKSQMVLSSLSTENCSGFAWLCLLLHFTIMLSSVVTVAVQLKRRFFPQTHLVFWPDVFSRIKFIPPWMIIGFPRRDVTYIATEIEPCLRFKSECNSIWSFFILFWCTYR